MKIILASASKRRQELLAKMKLEFSTAESRIDESPFFDKYKNPVQAVKKLALAKAGLVFDKTDKKNILVIGADTIIVFEDKVIGKPKDRKEAEQILSQLRGNKHQVITGTALINENKTTSFVDTTEVEFKNFSGQEMNEYLDLGLYLDRAGAYGIQDPKCDFVKSYKGSYANILGLPVEKLTSKLADFVVQ